jgi:nicotinamide-nucleotide amidase
VEKDKHILIAMPGPPREMQPMWHHEILPRLRQSATGEIIVSKTLKTFGLTEAKVGEMVSPLLSSSNPTLGVYAKVDGIHLRLTAKAQSQKQAEEMIAPGEARLRSVLGRYIWGTDSDTLEAVVGRMLAEKGLSLAVMESYTGGLLAATITDAPGASAYFKGGLIACSEEAQIAYGVDAGVISDCGASSAEAAQAMARAVRLHLGADIGVGIAGVDEPGEGEGRPISTIYIGIDDGKNKEAITARYPGDRAWAKRRAVATALFELRKILVTAE